MKVEKYCKNKSTRNGTVLVLYEQSGVFSRMYRQLGYNVIQVDKQIDDADVRLLEWLSDPSIEIVGILAFPPCTHLAVSGARWWQQKGTDALLEALSTVDAVFRLVTLYKPKFWMIENPVGRLRQFIGPPTMLFHPYEFDGWTNENENYTKKTLLWGKFTEPKKKKGSSSAPQKDCVHLPRDSSGRHLRWGSQEAKNHRSRSPHGFARAFVSANS